MKPGMFFWRFRNLLIPVFRKISSPFINHPLWCIYYSQDMENLEKMQNIILKSQDISAYLTPVDERLKREERPEYRYFFALLQEQLIMMMEGKKDFNLENVLRKIYGTEYTPVQAVRANTFLFHGIPLPRIFLPAPQRCIQTEVSILRSGTVGL